MLPKFLEQTARPFAILISIVLGATWTAAQTPHEMSPAGSFAPVAVEDGQLLVQWHPDRVASAWHRGGRWRVPDFPVPGGLAVALRLEPFSIIGPDTQLVVGSSSGPDRPLDFDPSSVWLFRGSVDGHEGSHVFLALSESGSSGSLHLGPGRPHFRVGSPAGSSGQGATLTVFESASTASLPPDVPACSVLGEAAAPPPPPALRGTSPLPPPVKHLELAVDTDHEFWLLFGDSTAAMSYLVQLYGAVSDIFLRDTDMWVELSFVRLWDNPNDLFNNVDPSPLSDFRSEWNNNMGSVQRDAAQLVSGRRDYPFGGQAYLSSLCGSNQYSVVGYMTGKLPDPSLPSPMTYDVSVTAHELGHNAGTGHTHDFANQIDSCDDTGTTPQRGSIMSYCGQTWSGGNANRDNYFHSTIQQNIEGFVAGASCIVDDCNLNAVDDALDVAGSSADANANGVPDECEDCNGNAVLDDADIAASTSQDLNANGVPDECEPDCDGNSVPDDEQIALGSSDDDYGNDIPDECEADCDNDGVSDYTEIQGAMPLDIDRNAVLDSCQDCDGDMTSDLDALGGGHGMWVASGLGTSKLRRFHASTGVKSLESPLAPVDQGQDLIVTDDGRVLVSSGGDNRVLELDLDGNVLSDLIPAGAGLTFPTGLLLRPGGELLVASRDTNEVLAFDATDGTPQGTFVTAGSGTLQAPFGLTLGPNGNLFVTSGANEILEYDGQSGAFVGTFVSAAANGGLDQPRGLVFKSDGNLLVASYGTDEVLEFEAGTGASLGKWAQVGTATRLTQISPWGLRVGPNGNVFVVRTGDAFGSGASPSLEGEQHHDHDHDDLDDTVDREAALHLTNAQMYEFKVANGDFARTHIGGNDHGLLFPSGFDFVPGWDVDCNFNLMPDGCDLSSGSSQDQDGNGRPDECDVDCNGNGSLDRLDIIPFGTSLDLNYNLRPDECDCTLSAQCDDGLACTMDSCNTTLGGCETAVLAGNCRIAGACYVQGEVDPANDCRACDPAVPLIWSAAPPAEVAAVVVAPGAGTGVSWSGQPAAVYDVAGGTLSQLAFDRGVDSAACLADGEPGTSWIDPRPDPPSGEGYYYVVRAEKSCGAGSYGTDHAGSERLPVAACP